MNAPSPLDLRRGWCPSALRPMETGDGWLVRLHPPGASLTAAQLRRIADLARHHGNGLIEISARANLQIRGVSLDTHPALVETLVAERLVDEHDGDGPQRLTLTAPSIGSDALIDACALASAIEHAGRAIAGLPAKTLVIVDDGGALSLDAFACDLRIRAVARGIVAIGLPDGRWLGPLKVGDTTDCVAGLLSRFARDRRTDPGTVKRMRDLSADSLDGSIAAGGLSQTAAPALRALPQRAGRIGGATGDTVLVGLPFGRGDASTLATLAQAAQRAGTGLIRLSPWRGLAFCGVEPRESAALLAFAAGSGLIVDPGDPRLFVEACAGKPACGRALSETMADAARLSDAAAPLLANGARIHVSGCVKSCAHAGASDLTLVGRAGGYDVVLAGTTRDSAIAALDLPAILARLRPDQDLYLRLSRHGPVDQRL